MPKKKLTTEEKMKARNVALAILDLSIRISQNTDAEVYCEYHGNYDSLRVFAYTKGVKHFEETRNMMESRWISKTGGSNIVEKDLQATLEDLVAFGKAMGYGV
jgi:hypothetical protein